MKRFLKKFLRLCLLLLLCPCLLATPSRAYERIDTGRETALTVFFGREGQGFPGVTFRLYRVAEVSESARFTLTEEMERYPVTFRGLDSAGWRALAQTLDAYIARDNLAPLQTVQTDSGGRAAFAGLPTGLYLVTGEAYETGRNTYTPEPFLLCLPNLGEDGAWDYEPAVSCKYDSETTPDSPGGGGGEKPETTERRVLKVWEDGEDDARPESIVVQLLKDGEVYDTVTLSQANNWRHTWTRLDADARWQVVEYQTPAGYTVLVEREETAFIMTNTLETEIPEEPVPGGPGESEEPEPDTPEEPNIPDEPVPGSPGFWEPDAPAPSDQPGQPGEETLPQTGVLWWPVPLLACGGLLLFSIGWGRRRRDEK